MRHSAFNISELVGDQIFVFGSNEAGRHGKGAAKTALNKWGAIYGQAEGLQGRTYGIPTVDKTVKITLSIEEIGVYVDRFIDFATEHPEFTFLVTEIGCGLAGLKIKDVAPLFRKAITIETENIFLPLSFWNEITELNPYDPYWYNTGKA